MKSYTALACGICAIIVFLFIATTLHCLILNGAPPPDCTQWKQLLSQDTFPLGVKNEITYYTNDFIRTEYVNNDYLCSRVSRIKNGKEELVFQTWQSHPYTWEVGHIMRRSWLYLGYIMLDGFPLSPRLYFRTLMVNSVYVPKHGIFRNTNIAIKIKSVAYEDTRPKNIFGNAVVALGIQPSDPSGDIKEIEILHDVMLVIHGNPV